MTRPAGRIRKDECLENGLMEANRYSGGYSGGCACGDVRFTIRGAAKRAGLCHCTTCRRAHASVFNAFVVFKRADVQWTGTLRSWESSRGYERCFCARCGSRVIAFSGDEAEVSMGSMDVVGWFAPQYESWCIHREPWCAPLAVPQSLLNK